VAVGAVGTTREEEEGKRSRRVIRGGDSVREIARMGPRVDSPICILDHVVGIPSREAVADYLVGVRKDLGCSSAGRMDSPLNRVSIRRCSVRIGLRSARKRR
jgi:hypothetical protein